MFRKSLLFQISFSYKMYKNNLETIKDILYRVQAQQIFPKEAVGENFCLMNKIIRISLNRIYKPIEYYSNKLRFP